MRTPATSVSKARSYSPSKCATSVEVPPMSNPMTRGKPASRPVSAQRHHGRGGAGEDGVLALEQVGGGEATRRHHEHQPRAAVRGVELVGHLRDVSATGWARDRHRPPWCRRADELDEGAHLVADGDLRKAHLPRQRRDTTLMLRVFPGVHEDDGDGLEARCLRHLELGAQGLEIGLALHRAVGVYALVHLDDAGVELLGLDDGFGEDVRARLVADAHRVAEALGGDEERALRLALQQRVGWRRWCPCARRR